MPRAGECGKPGLAHRPFVADAAIVDAVVWTNRIAYVVNNSLVSQSEQMTRDVVQASALPHLEFDVDRLLDNLDQVNPGVERMLVSARTGEGVDALRDWVVREPAPA